MTQPTITATDLSALLTCDRLVYLNHNGDPADKLPLSPYQKWLMRRGQQFEEQVVSGFEPVMPDFLPGDLESGFRLTLSLMRQGAPLISQGVLLYGDMAGMPDLLIREDGASVLGAYHYRPVDIKLASKSAPKHQLQVMFYMTLLEHIQGVRPAGSLYLRTPPDEPPAIPFFTEEPVEDDAEMFAARLAEVRELAAGREPQPFYASVCKDCVWRDLCVPQVEASSDVSLVTGLRRSVWEELHARGLGTLRAVAAASPEALVEIRGVGAKTADHIVRQARALVEESPVQFALPDLPQPDDSDVFFDVESLPGEGLIYLMGLLVNQGAGFEFAYDVARRPADEAAMWKDFLQRIDSLPGRVYHYGTYERTVIKQLVARYGEDHRASALLDRMVDLQKVISGCVTLPLMGYSLKDVAPWLGYHWGGETQAADDSMLDYYRWLESGDEADLNRILVYNEDDVRATKHVRDWLLGLRDA